MIRAAIHSVLGRRRGRFDVVFYSPFIGWMLTPDAPSLPGGAETQILRLAKSFAQQGGRVAIVVNDDHGDLPDSVAGVALIKRRPYPGNQRLLGKLAGGLRVWHALWRAPSRTVVYRTAGFELALLGIYTRLAGRRLVFSSANVVDFDLEKLEATVTKRRNVALYRVGIRFTQDIVVQTEEQVALCERSFGRTPVLIKSLIELAEAPKVAPEAFLWVGRLVSYKRPREYLELARAVPEATFWMVGVHTQHPERDRRLGEEIVREASAIPNLELLPPRPQPEIQRLMNQAVASVNTADFEGMPNVLLEAWAQGVPALVLTHDPDSVITRYGLGGFANGSIGRLAELARELWLHRDDRVATAERCQSYVATHHAPDVVAVQWSRVLRIPPRSSDPPSPAQEYLGCAA